MTQDEMTTERFAAIVAAYGANPARWPADGRGAAEALLARSAEARLLLAEASALDRMLDAVPAPAPMPGLRAAILAAAPSSPPRALPRRDGWRGFLDELGGWQVGPVLAASLALGLLAGGLLSQDRTEGVEPGLLQLAQFDDGFEEY